MKRLCLSLAVAALAACSAPSMQSAIPGSPSTTPNVAGSFTSSESPQRDPHATKLLIKSIGIEGTVNGQFQKVYVPSNCHATDVKGVAQGCSLKAKVALTLKITIFLFTGAKATGCVAAQGKFTGKVAAGKTIPAVLHWTGKC